MEMPTALMRGNWVALVIAGWDVNGGKFYWTQKKRNK